jgi:hypothetical protein
VAKIILNDVGHGGKSRVINDPNYHNQSVVFLTPKDDTVNVADFITKYGNIFDKKTSELDKPEKQAAQKKQKDKVYTFTHQGSYTFNSMVQESDQDYTDYKDYYLL